MLQAKDIERKFNQIDQAIVVASNACLNVSDASPQLVETMTRLSKQSTVMKQAVQANDQAKILRTVDELELIGEQAEMACRKDTHATASIKDAVVKVHRELHNLQQQLH